MADGFLPATASSLESPPALTSRMMVMMIIEFHPTIY